MAKPIALKQEHTLSHKLYLATTDSLANQLGVTNLNKQLCALSRSGMIMISKDRKNDKGCIIRTADGDYFCVVTNIGNAEGLLLKSFSPASFVSQNAAIQSGILFGTKGVCIRMSNKHYGVFGEFIGGSFIGHSDTSAYNNGKAVKEIFDVLDAEVSEVSEVYKPSAGLQKMLDIAKGYSETVSNVEEERLHESGSLIYTEIRPLNYDGNDRHRYRFIVTKLKDRIFKEKVQVDVHDKLDRYNTAEIIGSGKDGEELYVDLLFNRQLDINLLENIGQITLSYSDINRSVQLDAIEKISSGTAKAKYMDDILGRFSPAGFNDEDLSEVKAGLDAKKYPPNQSQRDAIYGGINSKDAFLVMGPPGTGKTTVIAEWVKYFTREKHMRVLISSQSNKAVDNVIERLSEEKDVDILRIGSQERLQENVKQCMFENKIASLRHNISSSAKTNTERLTHSAECSDAASADLEAIYPLADTTVNARKKLNAAIASRMAAPYKACISARKKFISADTAYKKQKASADKSIAKYEKLHGIENKVLRVLLAVVCLILGSIIRGKVKKLIKKKDDLRAVYSAYKSAYTKYFTSYTSVRDNEFASYSDAYEKQLSATKAALSKLDAADTFGVCETGFEKASDMITRADLENAVKRLKYGASRARATLGILGDWAETMENEQNYALGEIVMQSANIVGATCIGINSQRRFADLDFDVTIIDEAGQIHIQDALVPMSVSNKLIMLGDHKQIPPIADKEITDALESRGLDTSLYGKSLFEYMFERLPQSNKIMLDTQYRGPAEIADILSGWFYGGNYRSAESKRGMLSLLPDISKRPFILIDTGDSRARFETEVESGGMTERYNDFEADILLKICERLRSDGFDFSNLGVIAALNKQVAHISSKLKNAGFDPATVRETVASLDSFQGQERDIILFSFTRSSNKNSSRVRVGFLADLRRLNVAMSRCKRTLVMVGDMKYLSECERELDFEGNETDMTEKEFSRFITHMLNAVKEQNCGEIITSGEFLRRIEGR